MAKRVITKKTAPFAESASAPVISSFRSAPVPAPKAAVSDEQIRRRAYEIYLRRNGGPGDARSDWLQAETELRGKPAR